MMKHTQKLLFAALLCASLSVHAQQAPVSDSFETPDPVAITAPAAEKSPAARVTSSKAYNTVQEAAQAGLTLASSFAVNGREFCGAIIQHEGKFFHTEIVTNGERSACNFRVFMYKGDKIAGMFHVHPKTVAGDVAGNKADLKSLNEQSLVFSPEDIKTATDNKIPSYIYFQVSGETRVFVPGQTRMTIQAAVGRPGLNRVSTGDKV